MKHPSFGIVVVAAGSGARFGGLKQLALLRGEALLGRTLSAFDALAEATERVLVITPELEKEAGWASLCKGAAAGWKCVHGGRTRADSVRIGLETVSDTVEFVAVHDGARPFPPIESVRLAVRRLVDDEGLAGVVIATQMLDTVKRLEVNGSTIECTLERTGLARAETPQICRRDALIEALGLERHVTDEGQALELAGFRTEVHLHAGWNPKITFPSDLAVAEAWLAAQENSP